MDSKGRNVIVCDNGTGVSCVVAEEMRILASGESGLGRDLFL